LDYHCSIYISCGFGVIILTFTSTHEDFEKLSDPSHPISNPDSSPAFPAFARLPVPVEVIDHPTRICFAFFGHSLCALGPWHEERLHRVCGPTNSKERCSDCVAFTLCQQGFNPGGFKWRRSRSTDLYYWQRIIFIEVRYSRRFDQIITGCVHVIFRDQIGKLWRDMLIVVIKRFESKG